MPRPWKPLGALVALVLGAALAGATLSPSPETLELERVARVQAEPEPPNIVLIMTDDQNDYDLRWMPQTRSILADGGLEFTDAISPHPLCCPARAELVTGQYAQNNGVLHNNGPHGGFPALDSERTLGGWFERAGYQTGFVGKYLNKYGPGDGDQPGWSSWQALIRGTYDYLDFTFTDRSGSVDYRNSYVTEVIESRTNQLVRDFAESDDPFLLMSWHLAPHYRFDDDGRRVDPPSATQDRSRFRHLESPSFDKPSFSVDEVDHANRVLARRGVRHKARIREEFRARVRSLQSVDRAVASLVETLRATNEWHNTYLFFTSDNGYLLGEHRIIGKNVLSEEALQVPLLVRGPGIEPGSTSASPATLVDLPSTFADLADLTPNRLQDGSSLVPQLRGETAEFRDTTLVQTGRTIGDGWDMRGVRTDRYLYAARGDGRHAVLYDREVDPYELVNFAQDPGYADLRAELEARRRALVTCEGSACNRSFGELPGPS